MGVKYFLRAILMEEPFQIRRRILNSLRLFRLEHGEASLKYSFKRAMLQIWVSIEYA